MISSLVKNSWNWNFANFKDLALILPEAATGAGVLKNFKHLYQSLFLCRNFIKKEIVTQGFSCEFCKIFKNVFFKEHLWMTASILQQLLASYFAILYSWQLSNSGKTSVGKKIHPYISRILQIYISFTQIFVGAVVVVVVVFFDKRLFTLSIMQSVCCTLSSKPFCWQCFWTILKIWTTFQTFSKKRTIF